MDKVHDRGKTLNLLSLTIYSNILEIDDGRHIDERGGQKATSGNNQESELPSFVTIVPYLCERGLARGRLEVHVGARTGGRRTGYAVNTAKQVKESW